MMIAALAVGYVCALGLFDVQVVPLHHAAAYAFLAHADQDSTADLFVLDGPALTVYLSAESGAPVPIPLEEGTSAFDIADLNNDGVNELVAVCGDRIMRHALGATAATTPPVDMFTLHTQLSAPAGAEPYPYVMVVRREGGILLALPRDNTFELRMTNGALVSSYPMDAGNTKRVSFGTPFSMESTEPPQVGRQGALEAYVRRTAEFVPQLPDDLLSPEHDGLARRTGKPVPARAANPAESPEPKHESWPWFPLKAGIVCSSTFRLGTGGETPNLKVELHTPDMPRVLYSPAPPDDRDTLICLRESKTGAADISDRDVSIGPERRYPGALILLEDDLPDFNQDGYTDLVLWKAPEPGVRVDALTRVVTGGTWPIDITVHLFSPEKKRYEPAPAGRLTQDVPISWFLETESGVPLHHCVLRDFNGDGLTDLGACVAPNRYCAWCYTRTGFAASPDFDHTFPEPITGIEFKADLEGSGRTTIGLRTEKALYVLRPTSGR